MGAESIVTIPWGQEKITTATRREHQLGTLGVDPSGRFFKWARNGTTALTSGKLIAAAGPVANHQDLATLAATAANGGRLGDQTITVTLGATLATLDQYEDGFLSIRDLLGEGPMYRVRSNPAAAASANMVVTLRQGDDIRIAVDTTTQCSLVVNPYSLVVVAPTTALGAIVGVSPIAVPASDYFWCQVSGLCTVLVDTTWVVGQMVERSVNVAGAVTPVDYAGTAERALVGQVHQTIPSDPDHGIVNLYWLGA